MVYRQEIHRHPLPLRLGQSRTDEVVEAASIAFFDRYLREKATVQRFSKVI